MPVALETADVEAFVHLPAVAAHAAKAALVQAVRRGGREEFQFLAGVVKRVVRGGNWNGDWADTVRAKQRGRQRGDEVSHSFDLVPALLVATTPNLSRGVPLPRASVRREDQRAAGNAPGDERRGSQRPSAAVLPIGRRWRDAPVLAAENLSSVQLPRCRIAVHGKAARRFAQPEARSPPREDRLEADVDHHGCERITEWTGRCRTRPRRSQHGCARLRSVRVFFQQAQPAAAQQGGRQEIKIESRL